MKKLSIALATIAIAIGVQAATVNWNSGAFYTASSKDGGWSTSFAGTVANAEITVKLFYVDAATYNSLDANQASLYSWADGKSADLTGTNINPSNADSHINVVNMKHQSADILASTTYYAVLVAEYTDATYGDMYMAAKATATVAAQGTGTAGNIFGGASTAANGGIRDWQAAAVPEPTSSLLMLIGLAGLALRRRRA